MSYTVHEVARLSGVTIKTLYHYHKLGLLVPERVTEAGYRLYGDAQLKRLQQILFYRELGMSLADIETTLDNQRNRLECLLSQQSQLCVQRQRLDEVLETLQQTINNERHGEIMSTDHMFNGLNQQQWKDTLDKQNIALQTEYGVSLPTDHINADDLNDKAGEAKNFMDFMAESLRGRKPVADDSVQDAVKKHIAFLSESTPITENNLLEHTRFFLQDEFHRTMLESQQIGLSYYLFAAAEHLAKAR